MTLNYKNIIVGIDGSKEAEAAFKRGVEIAKRNNATLHLVNVIDSRVYSALEAYNFTEEKKRAEEFATNLLESYKNAKAEGLENINIVVEYGSPKSAITKDIAKQVEADLIICGATGLNAVERFLIGSVTTGIVRSAKCDVLVVRP
ncbi:MULTISPECIES: universal stress protein [unclassified Rummeliibacillus]|uniref:universal stress protein n=1 Tax=unclassified Rummeliibacillus TaxID=2622809 RepID=UPI000E667029|nr:MULTISPECIES: universal stress protein [unclassified Rummeliibacillus]RIJ68837.1 universal stress protein [Rummeliibacillus sp. POC4]RPJ95903.1 universal stress protein [Rummeliibacillus sp. TYF005]